MAAPMLLPVVARKAEAVTGAEEEEVAEAEAEAECPALDSDLTVVVDGDRADGGSGAATGDKGATGANVSGTSLPPLATPMPAPLTAATIASATAAASASLRARCSLAARCACI